MEAVCDPETSSVSAILEWYGVGTMHHEFILRDAYECPCELQVLDFPEDSKTGHDGDLPDIIVSINSSHSARGGPKNLLSLNICLYSYSTASLAGARRRW